MSRNNDTSEFSTALHTIAMDKMKTEALVKSEADDSQYVYEDYQKLSVNDQTDSKYSQNNLSELSYHGGEETNSAENIPSYNYNKPDKIEIDIDVVGVGNNDNHIPHDSNFTVVSTHTTLNKEIQESQPKKRSKGKRTSTDDHCYAGVSKSKKLKKLNSSFSKSSSKLKVVSDDITEHKDLSSDNNSASKQHVLNKLKEKILLNSTHSLAPRSKSNNKSVLKKNLNKLKEKVLLNSTKSHASISKLNKSSSATCRETLSKVILQGKQPKDTRTAIKGTTSSQHRCTSNDDRQNQSAISQNRTHTTGTSRPVVKKQSPRRVSAGHVKANVTVEFDKATRGARKKRTFTEFDIEQDVDEHQTRFKRNSKVKHCSKVTLSSRQSSNVKRSSKLRQSSKVTLSQQVRHVQSSHVRQSSRNSSKSNASNNKPKPAPIRSKSRRRGRHSDKRNVKGKFLKIIPMFRQ